MIVATSISALVLAMVTSGAIPADQVGAGRYADTGIGTVTSNEELRTDTPWLDSETLLAVAPVPGYLESEEYQRWTERYEQQGRAGETQKDRSAALATGGLLAYYPLNGYVKPESTVSGQPGGGSDCAAA